MRGTARVDPRSSTDARKHLTPLLQKAKQKSPNDMNLRQLQTSFVATNAMLTSDMEEDDLDTFKPLLEKWAKIVKEVKTPDELAEVYWTEVVSKVDVKTYGM